jgi:hypothetical protein
MQPMRSLLILALAACGRPVDRRIDTAAARGLFELMPINVPNGMSDLTIDDRGVLWAIAERDRHIVEIELDDDDPPTIKQHPLDGVPAGVDTEALVWLGDGHFAIGAEGATTPTASIMFGELRDRQLVVTRTRALSNADLGVELTANHGIEAVCGRADDLLAACETVGLLPDGSRYAPIVRVRGESLSVIKVKLTSDRGKLSALHCRFDDNGNADVIAIERHFGVARILKFSIGRDDQEVTPTIELDLHPILRDAMNLEGIVRLADDRFVIINDNQSKGTHGPTRLLVFAKR